MHISFKYKELNLLLTQAKCLPKNYFRISQFDFRDNYLIIEVPETYIGNILIASFYQPYRGDNLKYYLQNDVKLEKIILNLLFRFSKLESFS
jgi:hypothetical protein